MSSLYNFIMKGDPKVIVYDWDDTLFGWSDVVSSINWKEFNLGRIRYQNFYEANLAEVLQPIDFMRRFVHMVDKYFQIPQICVSACWTSAMVPAKQYMNEKYYPCIRQMYSTETPEYRTELIQTICSAYEVCCTQGMLVDDQQPNRVVARAGKINAVSPIGVYLFLQQLERNAPNGSQMEKDLISLAIIPTEE